jgi:penicillin amidase
MLRNVKAKDDKYLAELRKWNHELSANSIAASAFQLWWHYLYMDAWADLYKKNPMPLFPSTESTMRLLTADSSYFKDLPSLVSNSYKQAIDSISRAKPGGDEWYKVKNTTIGHLAKLPAFSYSGLQVGGWGNVVNAVKTNHGPSWRMVVQMSAEVDAYAVYPGGQSGNPGSKHYGTFIDKWTKGEYNKLIFLPSEDTQDNKELKYTWNVKAK